MKDHGAGFGKCAWGTAAFGTPGSYTYFRYNKAGWLEKQKNFNRTFAYYTWDKAGRESAIHHEKSNGDPLVTLDYARDYNGNITKISRESGRTFYYTYDRTEQLTSEIIKAPDLSTLYSFEYDYDGAGNRTRMIRDGGNTYYTYNKANELRTEFRGTEHAYFFYDGKGNTVRERQKDGFNRYYTYDADNMMTKVHYAETGERTDLYYQYNAQSENTKETHWSSEGENHRLFAYDGPSRILEHNADSTLKARFIFSAPHLRDGLVSPIRFLDSPGGLGHSYHIGLPNSVVCLAGLSQEIQEIYLIDSFGRLLSSAGDIVQPLIYCSEFNVPEIEGYMYFFRTYYPEVSRWLQRDRLIRYGSNLYTISDGNPFVIDALGLKPKCPKKDCGVFDLSTCILYCTSWELKTSDPGEPFGGGTDSQGRALFHVNCKYERTLRLVCQCGRFLEDASEIEKKVVPSIGEQDCWPGQELSGTWWEIITATLTVVWVPGSGAAQSAKGYCLKPTTVPPDDPCPLE